MTAPTTEQLSPPLPPGAPKATTRRGDRIFRGLSTGAGALVLVIMAGIALFLVVKAVPASAGRHRQLLHELGVAS